MHKNTSCTELESYDSYRTMISDKQSHSSLFETNEEIYLALQMSSSRLFIARVDRYVCPLLPLLSCAS